MRRELRYSRPEIFRNVLFQKDVVRKVEGTRKVFKAKHIGRNNESSESEAQQCFDMLRRSILIRIRRHWLERTTASRRSGSSAALTETGENKTKPPTSMMPVPSHSTVREQRCTTEVAHQMSGDVIIQDYYTTTFCIIISTQARCLSTFPSLYCVTHSSPRSSKSSLSYDS